MAISTSVAIDDRMTNPLLNIANSLSLVINNFETLNNVSNEPVNTSALETAKDMANEAAAALSNLSETPPIFDDMERGIHNNQNAQNQFNNSLLEGSGYASNLKNQIKSMIGAYVGITGIRKSISFIQDVTDAYNTQINAERQLMGVLRNMLDDDYVSQFRVDTTQAVKDINDIQNQIDDITVNVTPETLALQSEFDQIMNKASDIQSRGIYGDEAMAAAAAEFATYFNDVDAISSMMDTLSDYAMGMSGGGAIDSTQMVDYATNLGKIMSGSYDAMTKKGFEFTDVQKKIIEGTATNAEVAEVLGQEYVNASDDMRAAAAINQVIAESWEGLYEQMSNTPEGKIIQLTNKFSDLEEVIGGRLYPYILRFVDVINNNWGSIESIVNGISAALSTMMLILSYVFEGALKVTSFFSNNWTIIEPIILAGATALGLYVGYLATYNTVQAVSNGIKAIATALENAHMAAIWLSSDATFAETAAQWGLNAALMACPITWVVLGFVALVAIIAVTINVINALCGTSLSVIGVIAGGVFALGAIIYNVVMLVWNIIVYAVTSLANMILIAGALIAAGFDYTWKFIANLGIAAAEWIVNTWNEGTHNVQSFIATMGKGGATVFKNVAESAGSAASALANAFIEGANLAIDGINWIIDALNYIPGVDIGNVGKIGSVDWKPDTSGFDSYISKMDDIINSEPEKVSFGRFEYDGFQMPELLSPDGALADYMDIGDAYDAGYAWGSALGDSIDDFFNLENDFNSMDNLAGSISDALNNSPIGTNTGNTAGNTGAIKDALDITSQELKYLRDIAEQEVINRYTTAEIKVEMTNNNTVNNDMDLDGVAEYLGDKVKEQMEIAAEGVHS